MLTLHFLNVNHGDSVVIEYIGDDGPVYGLIDSNNPRKDTPPPALQKLLDLGAKKLSFIALTHPHADHYNGLSLIIDHFKDKISNFYSFPLNLHLPGRLKQLGKIYQNLHDNVESPYLKRNAHEFIRILSLANKHIGINNWEEPNGCDNLIAPKGFKGVSFSVILPHPKKKGPYFQMIENNSWDIVADQKLNDISMAFLIKYKGYEIILGGDCTKSSWDDHKTYCDRRGVVIGGNIIKLPHHGSQKDCSAKTIDHLFTNDRNENIPRIACISANGHSHPHPDIFQILEDRNVHPYCTNLSQACGANIKKLTFTPGLTPVFNRIVCLLAEPCSEVIQPCQGDIKISIDKEGGIDVHTQYDHPCLYRGDYDSLLPLKS